MPRRALALAACGFVGLLGPAGEVSAHDFWIQPGSFRPAPGSTVSATLLVGVSLKGDPLPRNPELLDRFLLADARGESSVPGEPFDEPAGQVKVGGPGPAWLVYQSHPSPLRLDAEKFESYLREEGLERIVEDRKRRGEGASPARELFHRCAKALLDVPAAAGPHTAAGPGAALVTRPLGLTLELVPGRNPLVEAHGKAALPLTLLFRGRPVAGALVAGISPREPDKRVSARTDSRGRVTLELPHGGFWLLKSVHMERAPEGRNAEWMSWWASITLELP